MVVWVFGASGGIGSAFARVLRSSHPDSRLIGFARDVDAVDAGIFQQVFAFDLLDTESFSQDIAQVSVDDAPDFVLIATGWLHDDSHSPEKTYRNLSAGHLQKSYQFNAIAPSLLIQALLQKFGTKHSMKIGVLSARLGSISDNKMGGWHSYRASKAALNMLIKNFALELKMKRSPITVFAIQPGTTDTRLSAPFQKGLPAGQLQTPNFTAECLWQLFAAVSLEQSGELIDFAGNIIQP